MAGDQSASWFRKGRLTPLVRLLGLVVSTAFAGAAIYSSRIAHRDDLAWWFLGTAFVLTFLWQRRLELPAAAAPIRGVAPSWRRASLGAVLALAGVALWVWAPYALLQNWSVNFDRGWLAWLGGALLLSVGLELLWGPRQRASEATRSPRAWMALLVIVLLGVAAAYRLGNLASFPGEGHISQIEELQNGLFGYVYLNGGRGRWEWLSQTWTSAAGIWLGGPTLLGVRTALAIVSLSKVIPVFLWLTYSVGSLGAVVGTALLACSPWDIIYARLGLPNQIFPAVVFALLAGIARRGRPAGYVWLGVVGGYLLYEYIAFRPLVVFILICVTVFSWRDITTHWLLRLARPLIVIAMMVSMGLPLFLGRLHGRIQTEYFDGLQRARGYTEYYTPSDSWRVAVQKRADRAVTAVGLFFFHGDANLAHNIGGRPLVDSVTGVLLLFGMAYGLTHFRRGVLGLTVLAFLLSLTGTLVLTGNLDVGRAATTTVYPYVLAGYGAAAVGAVFERVWQRRGRPAVVVLFTLAVCSAVYLNTSFLFTFWGSPDVRRAMHNNLSLLSSWLRANVRSHEHVMAVAPCCTQVLVPNDAMWLRDGVSGIAVPDLETALRTLATKPGPVLFVLFDESSTPAIQAYVEWLVPGLHMQFEPDPDDLGGEIAYAHLLEPPPDLAARIAAAHCLGVQGEYELIDAAGESLAHVTGVAPFIDYTTWSGEMGRLVDKFQHVTEIRMRFRASLRIDTPGSYAFIQQGNATQASLTIDGQRHFLHGVAGHLDAGLHTFEVEARFRGFETAQIRLLWRGPDSHERTELMPMYRLVDADAACAAGQEAGVANSAPAPASNEGQ